MFKLRKEQVDVLSEVPKETFVERGARNLRETFPRQTQEQADDEVRQFVRESIPEADRYLLKSEYGVLAYCHLRLSFGDDFHREPVWRRLLTAQDVSERERVDRILEEARRTTFIQAPRA